MLQAAQDADTVEFVRILHKGGAHRFTQDLSADWPVSYWSRVDEPLRLPPVTGKENSFFSVNPTCARVTDNDRAKTKNAGKADAAIERFTCSKNATVSALNCLYREYDAKDWVELSAEEIEPHYLTVVAADAARCAADPTATPKPKASLYNEATTVARTAKYKTDPTHYKALAAAYVDGLTPPPSVIVDSGGGYQCYFLLAETFVIRTHVDDHAAHVESYAADLQKRFVQMDARADQGVHDLRRILRIPGTYNHKKAYAPNFPRVSFVKKSFELRYTLAELAALLPRIEAPATTTTSPTTTTQNAQNRPYEGKSVIHAYNAAVTIADALTAVGYTQHGARMMRPGGDGQPGVDIDHDGNRSRHWSTNDALYDVHWRSPFNVFLTYTHAGNVRAAVFAAAQMLGMVQPSVDVSATLAPLRLLIKTVNLAADLPAGKGRQKVRPVVDGIFDLMQQNGRLTITVGKDRIAEVAGVSAPTVKNVLALLNGVIFDVTPTRYGASIALVDKSRLQKLYPLLDVVIGLTTGGKVSENDFSAYTVHKATDPFLSGTSRFMRKEHIPKMAQVLGITPAQAKADYTQRGGGEGLLLAFDTGQRIGDMTATEYAAETGIKLSAARSHLRRAEQMGLAESSREGANGPKVFSFVADFWSRIEELTPNLRTYKLQAQRSDDRLVTAIQYAQRELPKAQPEEQTALHRRIENLSAQRIPHLARLHDDMTTEEIETFAYDIALPSGLHPAKQAQQDKRHETARMDLAEAKHAEQWQATQTAQPTTPVTVAPVTGSVAAPLHRWQFVKDVAGIRKDLTRSALGNDWKKEALYLGHYLDGNVNDHTKAATAAQGMGLYYLYGLDWVGLRSVGTAQA
jgi:DNA-binding transcriptional ArsR family regulator